MRAPSSARCHRHSESRYRSSSAIARRTPPRRLGPHRRPARAPWPQPPRPIPHHRGPKLAFAQSAARTERAVYPRLKRAWLGGRRSTFVPSVLVQRSREGNRTANTRSRGTRAAEVVSRSFMPRAPEGRIGEPSSSASDCHSSRCIPGLGAHIRPLRVCTSVLVRHSGDRGKKTKRWLRRG